MARQRKAFAREADGFGVEFLDPVRHEVEELLTEHALEEELVFEALSPALNDEVIVTKAHLCRITDAIMALIDRRSVTTWQFTDVVRQHALRRLPTC